MTKRKNSLTKTPEGIGFWQHAWGSFTRWSVKSRFWQRLAICFVALIMVTVGGMYGIAQWYINEHKSQPLQLGATFIADYASYFGLDPKETLSAMVGDMGFKRLRLVSYWDDIEATEGHYNFDELDWEIKTAEMAGVSVTLSLGLRQPRWPECHMPTWAEQMQNNEWYPKLYDFITTVVNRYKDSPAIDSWQLENEYFLKVFGLCTNFDRDRLVHEFNMVKQLDPSHPVVISMSNNAIGTPVGQPTPDEWAIAVYKRVWDKTVTQRYFEYPIPAWYYAFRAGFTEITRGRDAYIHELQTEAWPPTGIKDASIEEQNKSLDAKRLTDRIEYGKATGMRKVDVWGVEWWYYRKVKLNDSSLWDAGKAEVQKTAAENQKLLHKDTH